MDWFLVRPIVARDKEAWLRLWAGYCDFYETKIEASTTRKTWERLLKRTSGMRGFVACKQRPHGFVNLVLHENTWSTKPVAYLEDLYVSPRWRGRSIGRALMSHAIEYAEKSGCDSIYWVTAQNNRTARRLYDMFTPADDVVRYKMRLAAVTAHDQVPKTIDCR